MTHQQPTTSLQRPDTDQHARWAPIDGLSAGRRALGHIRGRTITGKFACQLWNMPTPTWQSALAELRQAGYPITWTYGYVLDDPTVTGGYILR